MTPSARERRVCQDAKARSPNEQVRKTVAPPVGRRHRTRAGRDGARRRCLRQRELIQQLKLGGDADTIVGAGASFPYPLYTKWAEQFAATGGSKVNYQWIGSGGGISAVTAKTVDFGASDAPLQEADLTSGGLVQFPMCVGGVVPVVNIQGVTDGQLKLNADLLAKIYNGDITMWNDAAITAVNPGVTLPATKISVVHRSDSSGTTWIFTNYLQAAAPGVWKAGADKTVSWPTGVGGKGNEGVAASVKQLSGSIGYVEYAYAKQATMVTVQMQNKDGAFVKPSLALLRGGGLAGRLEGQPAEHVSRAREPARQDHLAHRRRLVHPRPEGPAGRRPCAVDAEFLRLGLQERRGDGQGPRLRADPRRRSTTSSRPTCGRTSPSAARPCGNDRGPA